MFYLMKQIRIHGEMPQLKEKISSSHVPSFDNKMVFTFFPQGKSC